MELDAAKMIGAGLAVIALFGVGIGIGNIFSTLIATVGRNPSVQQRVFPFAIIGFALARRRASRRDRSNSRCRSRRRGQCRR